MRPPVSPSELLQAVPPPWDYNPSRWSQRVPVCILAIFAAGIAGYMSLFQLQIIDKPWDPVFGKDTALVLGSKVAKRMDHWFRIPDAALGAIAYLGDAIFGFAGSTRRWQHRPWMVILFGIDVIPLGVVSAVLVVLQGTVVGHWCFLCLITAVISLALVYLAYDEVWSCLLYLFRIWNETRSPQILWKSFWGIPTREAVIVGRKFVAEQTRRRQGHQRGRANHRPEAAES